MYFNGKKVWRAILGSGKTNTDSGGSDTEKTYTVSGTWVFNESIKDITFVEQYVNFTSNGQSFTYIHRADSGDYNPKLRVSYSMGYIYYNTSRVYNGIDANTWFDQAYRTITFDGTQTVIKEFYEWFTANAVRQETTFTIDGTSYRALSGMTWQEWVESEYNTGGFYVGFASGFGNVILNGEKGVDDAGKEGYKVVRENGNLVYKTHYIKSVDYIMEPLTTHGGGTN